MSQSIAVYGAKGGAGTTTVVSMLANHIGTPEMPAVIVTKPGAQDDVAAVFGYSAGHSGRLTDRVFLNDQARPGSHSVIDGGVLDGQSATAERPDSRILVVRNRYLDLRRAIANDLHLFAGYVLVECPSSSIRNNDVDYVLDIPRLCSIRPEAAVEIGRALDAGLLISSLPNEARNICQSVIEQLQVLSERQQRQII